MAPHTPSDAPAAETEQNRGSLSSFLQRLSDSVDKGDTTSVLTLQTRSVGIARSFRWWAGVVSARPYAVISITTIVGVLLAVAFVGLFEEEKDSDDLFTPDDASSFNDMDYVDQFYGSYTARVGQVISLQAKAMAVAALSPGFWLSDIQTSEQATPVARDSSSLMSKALGGTFRRGFVSMKKSALWK